MIFAAGLGTRLRPLTNDKPKAMVELAGKPLLQHAIEKLKQAGFDEIIINVHHFADQIEEFLTRNQNFDLDITISDERSLLLDTGGGLKKAAKFFSDSVPFLVYNVDIFSDLDLNELYQTHQKAGNLATLAVNKRAGNRFFLFDRRGILCGWENNTTGQQIITRNCNELVPWYFCGIHVIDPQIFYLIKEEGVFSIVDIYLRLANEHKIGMKPHQDGYWFDLGTVEKLKSAENLIESQKN